eukprot:g72980.t1
MWEAKCRHSVSPSVRNSRCVLPQKSKLLPCAARVPSYQRAGQFSDRQSSSFVRSNMEYYRKFYRCPDEKCKWELCSINQPSWIEKLMGGDRPFVCPWCSQGPITVEKVDL